MYGYGQQAPFTYPSYYSQYTGGGYNPSLYSGFGLLNPSSNYQYSGGDGLYGGAGDGGNGVSSGSGISSSGSPTGSAIGDLGFAVSNMSFSPMAAAIASGLMDALSTTSVNSVNAISGLDLQSDIATSTGASTAAGADGPAGAGSTGLGGGIGGESGDASAAAAAVASDAAASAAASDAAASSDAGVSAGDSGGVSGADSGGEYMGGFIGMPQYIQGMVTRQNTFGENPEGPDDAYRKTQLGEYVIKKSAVQKYGKGLLDMINGESIPKTKLRGLL